MKACAIAMLLGLFGLSADEPDMAPAQITHTYCDGAVTAGDFVGVIIVVPPALLIDDKTLADLAMSQLPKTGGEWVAIVLPPVD